MVWDRINESAEHKARRNSANILYRQRMGSQRLSCEDWEEYNKKIDVEFEEEQHHIEETDNTEEVTEDEEEDVTEETLETEEEGLTEQDVLKRKMELLDQTEEELRRMRAKEYLEKLSDEELRDVQKKKLEELYYAYQRRLNDSFKAYKNVLNEIQTFGNSKESKSMLLCFENVGNGARLLFRVMSSDAISSPKQVKLVKEDDA